MSTAHITKRQKTLYVVHLPEGIFQRILSFNDHSQQRWRREHARDYHCVVRQVDEFADAVMRMCDRKEHVPPATADDSEDIYLGWDEFDEWRENHTQSWNDLFDWWAETINVLCCK